MHKPLWNQIAAGGVARWRTAIYAIEAIASFAGTLLSIGVFFYMDQRFGWGLPQNFRLAAGQGIVYVPGALSASWVARRIGRRRALGALYVLLAVITFSAWRVTTAARPSAGAVAALLLAYTFVIGISWPMLESLVAEGAGGTLGRRLGAYNIIWPATGALAIALEGTLMRYWPAGVFLIPMAIHLFSLPMLAIDRRPIDRRPLPGPPHVLPEPLLLRKRRLALWLSRIALPATYTVVYGLMPMMPAMPPVRRLPQTLQTVVGSVWLMSRWLAFALLALWSWWHTRPRLLLWSAVVMLVSFVAMCLPPTHGTSAAVDLISLIAWQALLGIALGVIYSGSLYFGMVLSEGSTEHGGYHEALIGLGWMIGPAAGAAVQTFRPDDLLAGVAAVGAVIAASVIAVLIAAVLLSRPASP